VRGISLKKNQKVVSLIIACKDDQKDAAVLTATQHGYGKRSPLEEYGKKGRGGQGVISIQVSKRNGNVVGARLVRDGDEAMLITTGGTLIRTRVSEISVVGRNTQGVRLIGLDEGETLAGVEKVVESDEE